MFSNPNAIIVNVRQQDIDNSSPTAGSTSLDLAIKNYRDGFNLDGINNSSDVSACSVIETTVGAYLDASSNPYTVRSLVCNDPYKVDTYASLMVAAEYLGFKPTAPYGATLTKAN